MIRLERLSKGFWVDGAFRYILKELDITLPAGRAMALLGRNGAGKSTLLQIIAGTMQPTSGRVVSNGIVSWPIGYAGSFHRDLTGAQNTRFLARAYGVDTESLVDFVEDFAEIGRHFYMPLRSYSSGMRARLSFGISMGIPFDTYLIDEVTAVGDARFKRKSKELFTDRVRDATAIMVSHSMSELQSFCDCGLVMHDGKMRFFDDIDAAIAEHHALMA